MKPLHFAIALLATVASSLYAQTVNMRADIPFEFRVGEKLMPAGEYLIRHTNGLLSLQESRGSAVAMAATHTADVQSAKAVLQFNRYGENYFLGTMSIPEAGVAWALGKTPREKELARRGSPIPTTVAFESK